MSTFQTVLIKISAASFACVTMTLLAVSVSPGWAAPNERLLQLVAAAPAAAAVDASPLPRERFAGAPDGVDPVVTGPVSTSFRNRQIALDCANAQWPRIPAGCYPE